MANPEHLQILDQGVGAWNQWRAKNPAITPELECANLSALELCGINLEHASLAGANISYCDLTGANLHGAHLFETRMIDSDLIRVNFSNAFVVEVTFAESRLNYADFYGAHFEYVDLSFAQLGGANFTQVNGHSIVFGDNDLSTVVGLETVDHHGPSVIGVDTVYRSKGNIPEGFLRGCGTPEDFIVYMRSLAGKPIEMYSCFISYSARDQEFAEHLHADLQNAGVRCWFAPHDARGGRKLYEQIDEAIRLHEKLLLILSPHSISSEWVKTEISKARKREVQEKKHVLFPVRLCSFDALNSWECFDADTGKDSAREIRDYFIPDFSNWQNQNSYQKAFDRLVQDLKTGKPAGKRA